MGWGGVGEGLLDPRLRKLIALNRPGGNYRRRLKNSGAINFLVEEKVGFCHFFFLMTKRRHNDEEKVVDLLDETNQKDGKGEIGIH